MNKRNYKKTQEILQKKVLIWKYMELWNEREKAQKSEVERKNSSQRKREEGGYAKNKENQKHKRFHTMPFIENEKYWGTRRKITWELIKQKKGMKENVFEEKM